MLDFFDDQLDPDWEIYVQPFVNGLRPDFVLLNPAIGIAVFEVKDWDLDAQEYRPDDRVGWLRVRDPRTKEIYLKRSPFNQAEQYGKEIHDIYCPRLGEGANFRVLTRGVIFTRASTEQARTLCQPELTRFSPAALRHVPVSGDDALHAGALSTVFPESERTSSLLMGEELADDMRRWLVEPQHAVEQRVALAMDARQRQFASTRTDSGFRRIRGPAGSGKTMVIAARAAALAAEGRSVLVVYFNLTLRNYLLDMYVLSGQPRRGKGVVWLSFHEWCRRTMVQAGREHEYKELWEGGRAEHEIILDSGLAHATLNAIQNGPFRREVPKYDAILVDEAQDFLPAWWTALRAVLNPGGEMLLVADRAQDIYERNEHWTERIMDGAGFRGPWSELSTGYRMPEKLQEHVDRFADEFDLERTIERTTRPPQTEMDFCNLRWHQVEPDELLASLMAEFHDLAATDSEFSMTDINFIVDAKGLGKALVASLESNGVKTRSTFSENGKAERAAKLTFYKGADRVKVTTIHSFKGWEAPVLIVGISSGDPELVYTALTRLKASEVGSHLHVVCSNDRFSAYGATWTDTD